MSEKKPDAIIMQCPQCNEKTVYDKNNEHRPFCSERCKLFDFGDWASESNRIAGNDDLQNWEAEEGF